MEYLGVARIIVSKNLNGRRKASREKFPISPLHVSQSTWTWLIPLHSLEKQTWSLSLHRALPRVFPADAAHRADPAARARGLPFSARRSWARREDPRAAGLRAAGTVACSRPGA